MWTSGASAQVFCQRLVSSLNVDDEPISQRLNQPLLICGRSIRQTELEILHLKSQTFVLQQMSFIRFVCMKLHRELFGKKMETCVFHKVIQ